MKARANTATQALDPSFAAVAKAFSRRGGVTSGTMMSSYGLKVNGRIFAMFGRGRFVAKLPKARVDQLVGAGLGTRFDPGHGRLMKEWIVITDAPKARVAYAKEAYAFVKKGCLA